MTTPINGLTLTFNSTGHDVALLTDPSPDDAIPEQLKQDFAYKKEMDALLESGNFTEILTRTRQFKDLPPVSLARACFYRALVYDAVGYDAFAIAWVNQGLRVLYQLDYLEFDPDLAAEFYALKAKGLLKNNQPDEAAKAVDAGLQISGITNDRIEKTLSSLKRIITSQKVQVSVRGLSSLNPIVDLSHQEGK